MASAYYRNFQTRADLDAAYDVENSVPDFTVYARQYVDGSQHARSLYGGDIGVKFGPSIDEYVDIFPATRKNAPVFIFIHGGYWRILSAGEFNFTALGPAEADVTVVVANYSLCPDVTITEIVRQMRALVVWVYHNIGEYNGDRNNIFVCGHSAGGHLAAMCALTDWKRQYGLPDDIIRGAIPISGLFNLEPIRRTFLQADLNISEREVETASPQRLTRHCRVPLLVSYGGDETSEFVRQSDEFLTGWKNAGNQGKFLPQMGRNHFNAITDLADRDSPLCAAIFSFMRYTPRRRRNANWGMTPSYNSKYRPGLGG